MQHAKGQACKAGQGTYRQDNGQTDIHPTQTQKKGNKEAEENTAGEEGATTQAHNLPTSNEIWVIQCQWAQPRGRLGSATTSQHQRV